MDVYVTFEDAGVFVYSGALKIVKERTEAGYWYEDDDAVQIQAERIVREQDEKAAERFLEARNEHEYERVEKQTVR